MLKIFYDLEPFFQDIHGRINVREYARLRKITAPTASKLLSEMHKEGLLEKENERNYIFYAANKNNVLFMRLSELYFLTDKKPETKSAAVIVGSFSKQELNYIDKKFKPDKIVKVGALNGK
jgi:Mn-dependent DtxR family transcriptional regulator